jgi:alanine racemase
MSEITAYVDAAAIRSNIEYLQKVSQTNLMAVVKANAYGHGLAGVVSICTKAGIDWFGVATLDEAQKVKATAPEARVLAWLYQLDEEMIHCAIDSGIHLAIFNEQQVEFLSYLQTEQQITVHLHVDTGMSRGGLSPSEAVQTAQTISQNPKFNLEGVFTHLVSSEASNDEVVMGQLATFREIQTQINKLGIEVPNFHLANSGGALNYDVSDFSFVRAGIALYGIDPSDKPNSNLKPAMKVSAPIIQLKQVDKGIGVGYNHTSKTEQDTTLALVPVGYADAIPRTASGKLTVWVNGEKRRTFGTISMDQFIIEAAAQDEIGDEVIIFGDPSLGHPTVCDLASVAGTISYEVLVRIGSRVQRKYLNL